jgi:hypothetical protein
VLTVRGTLWLFSTPDGNCTVPLTVKVCAFLEEVLYVLPPVFQFIFASMLPLSVTIVTVAAKPSPAAVFAEPCGRETVAGGGKKTMSVLGITTFVTVTVVDAKARGLLLTLRL